MNSTSVHCAIPSWPQAGLANISLYLHDGFKTDSYINVPFSTATEQPHVISFKSFWMDVEHASALPAKGGSLLTVIGRGFRATSSYSCRYHVHNASSITVPAQLQLASPRTRLADCREDGCCRVEIYHAGVWGTLCDDYWTYADTVVACRSAGCSPYRASAVIGGATYGPGAFGGGSGQVLSLSHTRSLASSFFPHPLSFPF
jgi:hypothetical protein